MKLDVSAVRHVASLARLAQSPEEELLAVKQLSAILDAVDELASVNTEGVEPTILAVSDASTSRPDAVGGELSMDETLANAPMRVQTFFALPKVLG